MKLKVLMRLSSAFNGKILFDVLIILCDGKQDRDMEYKSSSELIDLNEFKDVEKDWDLMTKALGQPPQTSISSFGLQPIQIESEAETAVECIKRMLVLVNDVQFEKSDKSQSNFKEKVINKVLDHIKTIPSIWLSEEKEGRTKSAQYFNTLKICYELGSLAFRLDVGFGILLHPEWDASGTIKDNYYAMYAQFKQYLHKINPQILLPEKLNLAKDDIRDIINSVRIQLVKAVSNKGDNCFNLGFKMTHVAVVFSSGNASKDLLKEVIDSINLQETINNLQQLGISQELVKAVEILVQHRFEYPTEDPKNFNNQWNKLIGHIKEQLFTKLTSANTNTQETDIGNICYEIGSLAFRLDVGFGILLHPEWDVSGNIKTNYYVMYAQFKQYLHKINPQISLPEKPDVDKNNIRDIINNARTQLAETIDNKKDDCFTLGFNMTHITVVFSSSNATKDMLKEVIDSINLQETMNNLQQLGISQELVKAIEILVQHRFEYPTEDPKNFNNQWNKLIECVKEQLSFVYQGRAKDELSARLSASSVSNSENNIGAQLVVDGVSASPLVHDFLRQQKVVAQQQPKVDTPQQVEKKASLSVPLNVTPDKSKNTDIGRTFI